MLHRKCNKQHLLFKKTKLALFFIFSKTFSNWIILYIFYCDMCDIWTLGSILSKYLCLVDHFGISLLVGVFSISIPPSVKKCKSGKFDWINNLTKDRKTWESMKLLSIRVCVDKFSAEGPEMVTWNSCFVTDVSTRVKYTTSLDNFKAVTLVWNSYFGNQVMFFTTNRKLAGICIHMW